ncbi:MAG: DUF4870 domain-containing protein [Chloroflexi bacterium]|nr:DUF4870 domain-containing protein [Chloroflexota bacterium]
MNENVETNRSWDVLCHLSALCMFIGIPFGNIIGPLVIWLVKKSEWPSVDAHGKESLNFQISLTLYLIIGTIMTVGLMFILIGFLLLPALIIAFCLGPLIDAIFIVVAAIKASNGQPYQYPLSIRFIS